MEIKTLKDYYTRILEMYPDVPKSDIRKILNYGWKSLYLHNSYGGDVLIRDSTTFIYFGRLMYNSIEWFNYYKRKLAVKIRVLFRRRNKGVPWDGYYYFAIDKLAEKEYWNSIKKKGRKRKWFTFGPVVLYKIKEECIVKEAAKGIIFRIPYPVDVGSSRFREKIVTDKAEVVLQKGNKFKDLLVTNNNYEYI